MAGHHRSEFAARKHLPGMIEDTNKKAARSQGDRAVKSWSGLTWAVTARSSSAGVGAALEDAPSCHEKIRLAVK
jgi:hypothetical protein